MTKFYCLVTFTLWDIGQYVYGDIQKVCSLKIPEFWPEPLPPPQSPLSPLFALVRFRVPPPHKVLSLWLELTLFPSLSILVKFREKKLILVSLVELNASFKKPQWNLCKVDTIGTWQKCSLYGDVRFIESPSKIQKFSKVNIKSTICHDFSSPKNRERLRKRQSFFHS